MEQKPKIKEAIIVEGRYDKIKLSSVFDALIIETGGFQIFKDTEQLELIRRVAEKKGVIIFTDSDSAGFLIRNHLAGSISPSLIKHAYIPDIYGKEKRKSSASKEGKLGVEGVPSQVIVDALKRGGATFIDEEPEKDDIELVTKTELYELGITGGPNSAELRSRLLRELGLPERMSTNAMLRVINEAVGKKEFYKSFEKCKKSVDI